AVQELLAGSRRQVRGREHPLPRRAVAGEVLPRGRAPRVRQRRPDGGPPGLLPRPAGPRLRPRPPGPRGEEDRAALRRLPDRGGRRRGVRPRHVQEAGRPGNTLYYNISTYY